MWVPGVVVFAELGAVVEQVSTPRDFHVAGAMLPPSVLLHILVSFGSQASCS